MKNFICSMFIALCAVAFVSAEEATIDFTKVTDYSGYEFKYLSTVSSDIHYKEGTKLAVNGAPSAQYGNILGSIIYFPAHAAHADIMLPYSSPNSDNKFGLIENVGAIKSVKVTTYGGNYDATLILAFEDGEGKVTKVNMGSLNFNGYKEDYIWNNPEYIQDPKNRSLSTHPAYPSGIPYMKLVYIEVHKNTTDVDNYVCLYLKDIQVIYDKATLEDVRDVDDESLWGLNSKNNKEIESKTKSALDTKTKLRQDEAKKQATESFDNTETTKEATSSEAK